MTPTKNPSDPAPVMWRRQDVEAWFRGKWGFGFAEHYLAELALFIDTLEHKRGESGCV